MYKKQRLIQLTSGLLVGTTISSVAAAPEKKTNILFIIVDDLRTELNCYGVNDIVSPNIDRLAASGVQFNQAYCNVPVSGASRASLMSGLRPTWNRFVDVEAKIGIETPDAITLPKRFKQSNYTTISNSKVIHGAKDALDSWSEIWKPSNDDKRWRNYLGKENAENETVRHGATAYECVDVEDNAYFDGQTAEKTIKDLQRLKKSKTPFFLAVGIVKPHLPFNAPKKYWDMYDFDKIQLPDNYRMDRSEFPTQAFHTWGEIRFYKGIPDKGPIQSDEEARRLIHGYKACVSYADAQVGAIMDELKRLELDKNTIVVLIGDHGWSLGNHGDWCKHSNFSIVNRAPMIFAGPGLPKNKKINELVEFVDLYPTICELAGVTPKSKLEGQSMVKLIKKGDNAWKNSAVIKWHSGLTIMTPDYRYTEWNNNQQNQVAQMLFDYKNDPEENTNIANDPKNQALIEQLKKQMIERRGDDYFAPAVERPAKNKGKKKNENKI